MKKLATILLALLSASVVWGQSGIRIETVHQDRPEFERIYHVRLNADVTMKIRMKWYISGVFSDGELDQTGGRWVLFEPERPADKILDRELLPAVEQRCREILQMDKAFRDSNPDQFADSQGHVWKRIK